MSTEADDMLAAISGAITPDTDTPAQEVEVEEQETDLVNGSEGADEAEADEQAEEETEAGEGSDEEKAAAEAAAQVAKPGEKAKKPDPINDPLPKGTLQSTNERFQHVVGKLKEVTTERDTFKTQYENVTQKHNELIDTITGTGLDGDTFSSMLTYAQNFNSRDPVKLEQAYSFALQEVTTLAKLLGKPAPGENPLAGFPDLVEAVEKKTMTPEGAIEVASSRRATAARAQLQQGQQATEQQRAQAQAQNDAAKAALTALGNELATKDGVEVYKAKVAALMASVDPQTQQPYIKTALSQTPPALRANVFRTMYNAVVLPKKAAPAAAKPGQQPLRGNKQPSGNGQAAPKSLLDAVSAGINNAGQ